MAVYFTSLLLVLFLGITVSENIPEERTSFSNTKFAINSTSMSLRWLSNETIKYEVSYYLLSKSTEKHSVGKVTRCPCWKLYMCTTLTGLKPNEKYHITVKFTDASGAMEVTVGFTPNAEKEAEAPVKLESTNLISDVAELKWYYPNYPEGFIKCFNISILPVATTLKTEAPTPFWECPKLEMTCLFKYRVRNLLPSTTYVIEVRAVSYSGMKGNATNIIQVTPMIEPRFQENMSLLLVSINDGTATLSLPPRIDYLTKTSGYFLAVTQENDTCPCVIPAPDFNNESLAYNLHKLIDFNNTWIVEVELRSKPQHLTLGNDKFTSDIYGNNFTNYRLKEGCEYSVSLIAINKNKSHVLMTNLSLEEVIFIPVIVNEPTSWEWFLLFLLIIPLALLIFFIIVFRRYRKRRRRRLQGNAANINNIGRRSSPNAYTAQDVSSILRGAYHKEDTPPLVKMNSFKGLQPQIFHQDAYGHKVVVADLEKYVLSTLDSGELKRQHKACPQGNSKMCHYGQLPPNKSKNRYINLAAFDETRVELQKINGDSLSDYINANYINGYRNPKMYIATQGPLPNTVSDFWRMVWQEDVRIICMLTNLIEDDKPHCEKYWPDLGEQIRYHNVNITNIDSQIYADFTVRHFQVTNNLDRYTQRDVKQLHFTSWPNHGVPPYARSVAMYLKYLKEIPRGEGPIVIHCSAGVGRTGTIILADINLHMAVAEGAIDVLRHLRSIRRQRPNLVVNAEQYKLVHTVLLDTLMEEPTAVTCDGDFRSRIIALRSRGEIDNQYHQLNSRCIRDREIVDYFDTGSIYSNAEMKHDVVRVNGFQVKDQFITTGLPTNATVVDFWEQILTLNISIIVVLHQISTRDMEYSMWPNPDQPLYPESGMVVRVLKSTDVGSNLQETIQLSIRDANITVQVLRLSGWPKDWEVPHLHAQLLTLWEDAQRLYSGMGHILVVCCDGVKGCGLFVSLAYLVEKIKFEKMCDVCDAVRTVRESNEKFIISKVQFNFLYEAATEFLEAYETYANFQ